MPILTPQERVGALLAGRYRIERIVATGGMATVFGGVHEWTQRAVAVKILHYEYAREEEIVGRFLQEARAASQLKHPNVVDVLDMGKDEDGTVYLVMELLEGETLKARMKRGGLGLDEIVALLAPVMRAVAMAHKKGVVHRDLKPDNVFLAIDPEDEEDARTITPKLLDFGIAKVTAGDSGSTRTGTMVGTPHYMAPEQVRGDRGVGPPADVWSMGVVLFACLSGRRPFEAESTAGVIGKLMVERAPPLGALAPSVPVPVVAVVDRALQRDPAERFVNMGEMLGALEDALAQARADAARGGAGKGAPGASAAELAAAPTVVRELPAEAHDPVRASDPDAAHAPSQTPFQWAPPAQGERPRGSGAWVAGLALALVAIAGLGGAAWWATRPPETVATPLAPPSSAVAPSSAVTPPSSAPVSAGGAEVARPPSRAQGSDAAGLAPVAAMEASDTTATDTAASDTAPNDTAASDAAATAVPSPTLAAEREARSAARDQPARDRVASDTGGETVAPRRAERSSDTGSTGTRAGTAREREPRRGTRGALILR